MKKLFYIVLCMGVAYVPIQAQTLSEMNKRREKAENEIAYINKLLKTNANKKKSGIETLELTQQKIKQRRQVVADINQQVYITEQELQNKKQHIAELQNHLKVLKKSYEKLIYQAYKLRNQNTWMMFVLSSDDLGMAYRRWMYFRRFSEHISELGQNIKETSTAINTAIVMLNTKKQELSGFLSEKEKEVDKLQAEEQESKKVINSLAGQERKLSQQIEKQRKEIEKINRQIERIIAEETKKKGKDGAPLPVDRVLTAKFENNRGNLPWPVRKGVVTSRFGRHPHPVYKNVEQAPNNGIDITTEPNSAAISVFNGKVTRILFIPGKSNFVIIQHGEYYTVYGQLGQVAVHSGDEVKTGQNIGTIVTGAENNTVLHFELWKGTDKQNPELWLAK
ncbi:MAG: peptidoglycan DD-metalloendopeptidase family protein [Prevotellaceae bacterium]|jgi:murein DD-endopeptidase MepM/ murein hydrolase activator NlpD|nr:peptidoglycan DD-metalloendopeptidase family protein [Prevotellaceae bacterium]